MEEKTEAMASQLSSSDVVDDIYSKLPEQTIHRILSFLPSTKDVVRTSVISKSGLQAWRTFPIPEFNIYDFLSRSSSLSHEKQVEAKTEQFIRFVDTTMQRFENGNRMKIFNLSLTVKEQMMAHHITRWIGMALDNKVEHLALDIYFKDASMQLPGLIPDRVLSAYWLKSLKLDGCRIYIPLSEGSCVDLPLLTSLRIKYSNIPDEELQKLLSGCPALEYIALVDCNSLSKIDIFYHPNLEKLKVSVSKSNTRADNVAIRVRAPKLKSFNYNCHCTDDVKIHKSPKLKSLRISSSNMTDEWFHTFIAQFLLIEELTIDWCLALRKIRISNPLLEKISIIHCYRLKDVGISSKKLASFSLFTRPSSIPKLSIPMEKDNPPNDCTTEMFDLLGCDLLMEASWYCKLKDFLSGPFIFKSINIWVVPLSAAISKKYDLLYFGYICSGSRWCLLFLCI